MVSSPHPAVTCGHNESTKHALVINCRGRKYTSHTTLYNDIILWLNMGRDKSSPGSASLLLLQQPISSAMFSHDCLKSRFVLTYDPIVLLKYVYLRLFKYICSIYVIIYIYHWDGGTDLILAPSNIHQFTKKNMAAAQRQALKHLWCGPPVWNAA